MVSVTQAAEQLGVDKRTIHRRLERGEMRGMRVHEKLWLVPQAEVERWKQRGKLKPGPKPGHCRHPPTTAVTDAPT